MKQISPINRILKHLSLTGKKKKEKLQAFRLQNITLCVLFLSFNNKSQDFIHFMIRSLDFIEKSFLFPQGNFSIYYYMNILFTL